MKTITKKLRQAQEELRERFWAEARAKYPWLFKETEPEDEDFAEFLFDQLEEELTTRLVELETEQEVQLDESLRKAFRLGK